MMVNRARCETCGDSVDYLRKDGPIFCGHCGDDMEFVGKVGCVRGLTEGQTPNDDLRELAGKWRDETEEGEYRHHYADELEELIDDE